MAITITQKDYEKIYRDILIKVDKGIQFNRMDLSYSLMRTFLISPCAAPPRNENNPCAPPPRKEPKPCAAPPQNENNPCAPPPRKEPKPCAAPPQNENNPCAPPPQNEPKPCAAPPGIFSGLQSLFSFKKSKDEKTGVLSLTELKYGRFIDEYYKNAIIDALYRDDLRKIEEIKNEIAFIIRDSFKEENLAEIVGYSDAKYIRRCFAEAESNRGIVFI